MTNEEYQELLTLAAKAAGIFLTPTTLADVFPKWEWDDSFAPRHSENGGLSGTVVVYNDSGEASGTTREEWNPRDNSGDSFELAVKLGISITPYPIYNTERHSVIAKQRRPSDTLRERNPTEFIELYGDDPCAAARLAILRAAAEIGRAMP